MGVKADLGAKLESSFDNLSNSMYNASDALLNIKKKREEDAQAVKDAYNKSTLQQLLAYQDSIYFKFDPQNPDNEGYVQKLSRTYDLKEFDALESRTVEMMYEKMDELQVDPEVRKMWEENYMPDFKLNLNKAKQDAYTSNIAVKTANLWESTINATGADSNMDYAKKVETLTNYWNGNGLGAVKAYVGDNMTTLEDAIEAMQQASVTQYVDRYYASTPNPQIPVSQIAAEAVKALKDQLGEGQALDSDTEFAFQSEALKRAQAHEDVIAAQAQEAQNKIVTDFRTMQYNGEWDGDPDDVIQAAVNAGAIVDGQIDRNWVSFLAPYLDKSDENQAIAEATARINAEVEAAENVTPEMVTATAAAVSDGSFTFTPETVHEGNVPGTSTKASGAKIPLSTDRRYGAPVLTTADGTEGTGLQVTEKVEVTPQGEVVVEDEKVPAQVAESADGTVYVTSDKPIEELNEYIMFTPDDDAQARLDAANAEIARRKALDRNYVTEDIEGEQAPAPSDSTPISIGQQNYVYKVAEEDRPVFDKDYKPYEGTEAETESDIAAAALELTKMTEDTDYPNMFNADGDLNFDNSRGKYTYKYNGLPDIETNYAPVVMALCQSCGITYDKDSYAVYKMAQNVYDMEMAGAFTNPNKALAVQTLSVKRLDPNFTPEQYNALVMEYKSTGKLTDDEINAYNLEKHAFAGDLSKNSSYNDALKVAYSKAFTALFNKTYSTDNISKINENAEKSDQWFRMQRDLETELTLAYQLDPTGVTKDPLKAVNEIVTKLTDKTFSEDLLSAVLKAGQWSIGTWISSTQNREQLGDNSTVSDMLADYFRDPGKYADRYDTAIMQAVEDRYYGTTLNNANHDIGRGNAKAQIKELAKDFFGKEYKELSVPEKNQLLFSYAYARTRTELTRAACMTFGYGLDEVYGNVTVSASGGIGGGMAVVTKDGRVYMSSSEPDGSGHGWLIGSVSQRTLENIQKGATTVSFDEISTYGVKTFNDQNYTFDKAGSSLTRQKTAGDVIYGGTMGLVDLRGNQGKKDADKEMELVDIYDAVQPGRYNIIDLGKH